LTGVLISIEGIDGAGKETLQKGLHVRLRERGRTVRLVGFPDYETPVGGAIRSFLAEETHMDAATRQLLYAANRFERGPEIEAWLAAGNVVISDRYISSGLAYGLAQGLDLEWMRQVERILPEPDWVLLVDISVETSLKRTGGRDRYERDAAFLEACRAAYLSLAEREPRWHRLDGERSLEQVLDEAWNLLLPEIIPS